MLTKKLVVEVADAKRFNDKGVEVMRSSDKTRTAENGTVYHVYTGDVVEADKADFENLPNVAALANRVKSDLYADDDKPPLACLADVLNNGGLRLAYGDAIKRTYRLGGGKTELVAAMTWLTTLADITLLTDFRSQPEAERTAWLIEAYRTRTN